MVMTGRLMSTLLPNPLWMGFSQDRSAVTATIIIDIFLPIAHLFFNTTESATPGCDNHYALFQAAVVWKLNFPNNPIIERYYNFP
jgi:hypothetical protein